MFNGSSRTRETFSSISNDGQSGGPRPFVAVVAFVVQAIAVEKRCAISNPLAISGASTAGTTTCRPVRVGTSKCPGSTWWAVLKMSLYVSAPSPATYGFGSVVKARRPADSCQ